MRHVAKPPGLGIVHGRGHRRIADPGGHRFDRGPLCGHQGSFLDLARPHGCGTTATGDVA